MRTLLILFSFILCVLAYNPKTEDNFAPAPTFIANISHDPYFSRTQLGLGSQAALHSSNVIELFNGDLLVSWFAGSREGHRDVAIYTQRFKQDTQTWQNILKVTDAQQSSVELNRYIKKVGNAVITQIEDKHLMMFYVSVSIGGWATSQINIKHSFDNGQSWDKASRMVSSPFFNISTLVRAHPIKNTNNEIWLPAYYELAYTSSLIIKIDKNNKIQFTQSIPTASEALAPVFLQLDESNIHVVARPKPAGYIHSTDINIEAKQISMLNNTNIDFTNPNASIDAIVLTQNLWLMAYNPLEQKRGHLGLAISVDQGNSWIHKKWIETEKQTTNGSNTEYSYPSLFLKQNGAIVLSYTHNRSSIILNQFNLAWLMSEPKL
ncbi:MAG: exo-alpha-sialidase [Saccharospirillaceae bacterium]|nr:exo-alpha-sialidase [Pseudomonadales bacterium]NRB80370.1 exo-alpha-sialidase [Saccharospirillaceae bacterium]